MKVLRAYKFRLYPSLEQEILINKSFVLCLSGLKIINISYIFIR